MRVFLFPINTTWGVARRFFFVQRWDRDTSLLSRRAIGALRTNRRAVRFFVNIVRNRQHPARDEGIMVNRR